MAGVLMGVCAYAWWGGVTAVYVKSVSGAHPLDVLAHRIVWASLNLLPFLLLWPAARKQLALLRSWSVVRILLLSTTCIVANWLAFIYAVSNKRLLEASVGYFVTPLVSVLLARVFLAEHMTTAQKISIAFGVLSVVIRVAHDGTLSWISGVLALSFGCYGLLRKRGKFAALPGLALEATIAMPFAAGFLLYRRSLGLPSFGQDTRTTVLLLLGGIVTIVPLLCFAGAAKRLRLTTLGMIQYLAPIGQLVLSVLIFKERKLEAVDYITLGLIWVALAMYTIDGVVRRSRQSSSVESPSIEADKLMV